VRPDYSFNFKGSKYNNEKGWYYPWNHDSGKFQSNLTSGWGAVPQTSSAIVHY